MKKLDWYAMENAGPEEKRELARLAIGRLLRICSRPFQEGDVELYEEARSVLLHVSPQVDRAKAVFPLGDPRGGAQGG